MNPLFFPSPAEFRHWLAQHHATATELLVGFHKVATGKPSLTWPESVDEALCVGWIDGIRKRIDEHSYTIRFTSRRVGSIWSAVNIRRVQALSAEGRMQPAGMKAFAARKESKSGIYAYEQPQAELPEPYAALLKKNQAAWTFFQTQPPSYRQRMCWRVVSAKQEATRLKRLERLIAASAGGKRI